MHHLALLKTYQKQKCRVKNLNLNGVKVSIFRLNIRKFEKKVLSRIRFDNVRMKLNRIKLVLGSPVSCFRFRLLVLYMLAHCDYGKYEQEYQLQHETPL